MHTHTHAHNYTRAHCYLRSKHPPSLLDANKHTAGGKGLSQARHTQIIHFANAFPQTIQQIRIHSFAASQALVLSNATTNRPHHLNSSEEEEKKKRKRLINCTSTKRNTTTTTTDYWFGSFNNARYGTTHLATPSPTESTESRNHIKHTAACTSFDFSYRDTKNFQPRRLRFALRVFFVFNFTPF